MELSLYIDLLNSEISEEHNGLIVISGIFNGDINLFGSHRGIRTPVTAVRGRRPEPLDDMAMAAGPGFEPGQHDPESWVLPLHNPAIFLTTLQL
jgi:hypothetical protein